MTRVSEIDYALSNGNLNIGYTEKLSCLITSLILYMNILELSCETARNIKSDFSKNNTLSMDVSSLKVKWFTGFIIKGLGSYTD